MKSILLSCLVCTLLASCGAMYEKSFNYALPHAVLKNNTQSVAANISPANAVVPFNGVPLIYYAALHGNEQVINLLHNNGASIKARGPQGKSLAYAAASGGHPSTARKLIALGSGTTRDLADGAAAYERKKAAEREANRILAEGLKFLAAAMLGGGGGGGGDRCSMCGSTNDVNYAGGVCYQCNIRRRM